VSAETGQAQIFTDHAIAVAYGAARSLGIALTDVVNKGGAPVWSARLGIPQEDVSRLLVNKDDPWALLAVTITSLAKEAP
jgi:hypothetical protein